MRSRLGKLHMHCMRGGASSSFHAAGFVSQRVAAACMKRNEGKPPTGYLHPLQPTNIRGTELFGAKIAAT